jgi:hypothetical protein
VRAYDPLPEKKTPKMIRKPEKKHLLKLEQDLCLLPTPKAHVKRSLDFSFVFSGPFTRQPEETCFHQDGSSAMEGTSQAELGSSDQRKVPASLSLFLKNAKIPALLGLGKGLK